MTPTNGHDGQQTLLPITPSDSGASRSEGKVTYKQLLRLLDAQYKRCALTGVDLTPQTVSLDHIHALEEGGADDISNVQLVHHAVNDMKGTMSQDEFVRWCKLVASHCIAES